MEVSALHGARRREAMGNLSAAQRQRLGLKLLEETVVDIEGFAATNPKLLRLHDFNQPFAIHQFDQRPTISIRFLLCFGSKIPSRDKYAFLGLPLYCTTKFSHRRSTDCVLVTLALESDLYRNKGAQAQETISINATIVRSAGNLNTFKPALIKEAFAEVLKSSRRQRLEHGENSALLHFFRRFCRLLLLDYLRGLPRFPRLSSLNVLSVFLNNLIACSKIKAGANAFWR